MRTDDTRWLNRKTWRRLVELHVTGRITRAELQRLKGLLARTRPAVPATPRERPRLTLLQGGGQRRPLAPLTPSPREVA